MPDSLICAGVFDDTAVGSTVGTEPLLRQWDIQGDELVVPECFDFPDCGFLRKFC